MDKILELLPSEINTAFLIGAIIGIYKLIMFISNKVKQKKAATKEFAKEVVEKERVRSKFESRLKKVEEEMVSIREDFKEKNAENKEDFIVLSKKIDKILDILIQPIKK